MFAARGNVRALDRARRVGRHVSVLALCAVGIGVGLVTPAQADKISDTKAEANRVWEQIQSDGERLEQTVERYNGARYRLSLTIERIQQNETRLASARVNLTKARHALNITIINAYKNPQPDPLEAALSARNFGQVLDQFALLDRAQSYNAGLLTDIRDYRKDVDQSQRVLNRERNARRDAVAELTSLKSQITASIAAEKTRYGGLRAKVRRSDRRAPRGRARRVAPARPSAHAGSRRRPRRRRSPSNDIGGVSQAGASVGAADADGASVAIPAPSTVGESAANIALGQLGTPYVWGGGAPGGFDCSGLVSWAYGQAGQGGLPHFTGALWNSGTHVAQSDLAPGDLVFFHGLNHVGLYIGGGSFVHAPHTGDVVKISSLAGYSGYVGAVRVSG